jgi:hypothetical protein
VAEHHREQPDDPLGAGLVGKDGAEEGKIDLRLFAGRGLEATLERLQRLGRMVRRNSFTAV